MLLRHGDAAMDRQRTPKLKVVQREGEDRPAAGVTVDDDRRLYRSVPSTLTFLCYLVRSSQTVSVQQARIPKTFFESGFDFCPGAVCGFIGGVPGGIISTG